MLRDNYFDIQAVLLAQNFILKVKWWPIINPNCVWIHEHLLNVKAKKNNTVFLFKKIDNHISEVIVQIIQTLFGLSGSYQ